MNPSETIAQKTSTSPKGEIICHVFLRSFYDSNGDMYGDFNGLREKLDYLQQLGVTSILLLPTCQSDFYHNYFSSDFEKLDPKYGTTDDWLNLLKEVHRRKMKIYLDMELQYVTEDHPWFRDSYNNPKSQYSHYILYKDSSNKETEPLIFGITSLEGYDGTKKNIAVVNLRNHDVQKYFFNVFSYWIDPNHDRKFDDSVDGFRCSQNLSRSIQI
ncbi:MAG: alpha-amylase family glycosyl hydrolase [Chitinophagales bacterium]